MIVVCRILAVVQKSKEVRIRIKEIHTKERFTFWKMQARNTLMGQK